MLKVEISNGRANIEADGSMKETVIETGAMIAGLYQKFAADGPEKAGLFKYAIQGMVQDGSPVWDSETVQKMEIIEILTKEEK